MKEDIILTPLKEILLVEQNILMQLKITYENTLE